MSKSVVIIQEYTLGTRVPPLYRKYYLRVEKMLRGLGYSSIYFCPLDQPPPYADLWVSHGDGVRVLKYAPYGTETMDLGLFGIAREHISRWGEMAVRVAAKSNKKKVFALIQKHGFQSMKMWDAVDKGERKFDNAADWPTGSEESKKPTSKKEEAAKAKEEEKKKKQEQAQERKKPLALLIEEKYAKTWRGKNPKTDVGVGYWTVRGWLGEEDKELRRYAKKVFAEFKKSVEEDKRNKVLGQHTQQMTLDFGWPQGVIKEDAFNLDLEKPISQQEVDYLATAVRNAFKTPEFKRGVISQYLDKKVSGVKSLVKMMDSARKSLFGFMANPFKKQVTKKVQQNDTDFDIKDIMSEVVQGQKEIGVALGVFAATQAFETLLPQVLSLVKAPAVANLLTTEGLSTAIAGAVSAYLPAGAAKVTALAVPSVVPLIGGAPIVASIIGIGIGALVGKVISKAIFGKTQSSKYEQMTIDIFTGEFTPEEIEEEYDKKMDKLLKKNLPPDELRKELLALYTEFHENARPAIEKALYMMGKNQGGVGTKGFFSFLKTGADKSRVPTVVRMRKILDQFETADMIQKTLNTKGFGSQMTDFFNGKTKIPAEMMSALASLGVVKSGESLI